MVAKRFSVASLRIAGAIVAFTMQMAPAAAELAVHPAQIDRNGVLILVRSTLLALDQANHTGNYTVLRDLGAPAFSAANSAARLGDIFASQRRDEMDLSGVAVLEPQLTLLPQIEANGLLHMTGFFPSVPKQVNFELLYSPVNGHWRLFGLSVNLGPSGPVAPTPPAPAAADTPLKPRPHPHVVKHETKHIVAPADAQ